MLTSNIPKYFLFAANVEIDMNDSISLSIDSNELSQKIFLPTCGGFRINNRLYDYFYVRVCYWFKHNY